MNLLMISGDRSILQGRKGAFFYTLEEFHRHWDRVDIICPAVSGQKSVAGDQLLFGNVFFHPNPRSLWWQECWIRKRGLELIQEHKHDVMTVHDYPPFYNGAGAMYLGKKTGIPYVLEIHHVVGYPKAASITEFIGRIMSRFYIPWASRKATSIRCVNALTKEVLERWGVPENKMAVYYSFYLDHAALKPDESIKKKYDFVTCSRLVANKGIKELLHAMSKMPKKTLLVIGDGPQRNAMDALAHRLHISDRITFAGWLKSKDEVYKELQTGKIFIMNSRSEGGPRVTLEAMALGLPVISTRVGVAMQFFKNTDGMTIEFVDTNIDDFVEKAHQLLVDKERREQLGKNGKDFVLHTFERAKIISLYADFLKSLAS